MEASQIEFRIGADIPLKDLVALYDSVGWKAYTLAERCQDLGRAIANSTYVVTAWDEGRLVGLARGLSDDVSVFYLQDLVVLPSHQNRGIGTRLLKECMERFKHVRLHILLTDDDERAIRFYRSHGFHNVCDLRETPLNAFVRVQGVELA